jgi:hypothetical protein
MTAGNRRRRATMVALFIALWVLILAPLALAPMFLMGDTDVLNGPARHPVERPIEQPREVKQLACPQAPQTHGRAAGVNEWRNGPIARRIDANT